MLAWHLMGGMVRAHACAVKRCNDRTLAAILAGVLAMCVAHQSYAQGQFCGDLPARGFDQAPNGAHSGRYVNRAYGYSVIIPKGFTAYTAAVGPERGFGMILSWAPRAIVQVDAGYDAFYDITAAGVHRRDLNTIRLHNRVLDDRVLAASLAHVAGGRYLTDVQCTSDPQRYRRDDVIVIRYREIYRINLQTVPARYASDVRLINAMLKSWRWVK